MRRFNKLTKREARDALRAWSAVAVDRDKAKASDSTLGLDREEKVRAKPMQREASEQARLMLWARYAQAKHPELALLYAVPNGGARDVVTAARLKMQGVKAGVPDLHLPVPRRGHIGLWIELKAKGGRVSDLQSQWIDNLRAQGHRVEVCVGWEAARAVIEEYLQEPGWTTCPT